jgi:alanine racemase
MKKVIVSRKDLKNNLNIIRKRLYSTGKDDKGNNTKIIAVVKGNGMGLRFSRIF